MTSCDSELTSAELNAVLNVLRELADPGRILEVGTAAGGTLTEMIRVMDGELQGTDVEICVLDTFEYFKDHERVWRDNLSSRGVDPGRVRIWKGKSARLWSQMWHESVPAFSFILIDAGHKLKDVIRDVRWLEFLEVDGIAAFHDYTENFPGVCRAVDLFLARNPEFEIDDREGSLIIIRKTRPLSRSRKLVPVWLVAWLTVESVLGQWKQSVLKRLPGGGVSR